MNIVPATRVKIQDPFYEQAFPVIEGELVPVDLDAVQDAMSTALVPYSPALLQESLPPTLRQGILEDPYWLLMGIGSALALGIVGTAIYGIIQVAIAVEGWWSANGHTVASTAGGVLVLVVLLALCGGGAVAKCGGIHCGGCKG